MGAVASTVDAASDAAAQLAQLMLGLGLMIGLVFLLVWLVYRMQQTSPRGNHLIRTLASQPLGPRNRLALTQIGKERILLSLTPDQIMSLHVLKEPVHLPNDKPATPEFTQHLSKLLDKDPKGES